jgi:translation elongation factor EF-G
MDSRQDEQERGITMKSSALTLVHTSSKSNQSFFELPIAITF